MDSEVLSSGESLPLLEEEQQDFDLQFLDHHNSKYSKETKVKAVSLFLATGSQAEVCRELNIPAYTLSKWKNDSPWWNELTTKIRKEQQRELDVLVTNTIHKAVHLITDRLEYGDYKFNARTGETVRIPVSAKDLSVTMAVLYDKRALLRGEATAIRQESKSNLALLEEKLKQHALQLKEKDVVSTQ